MRGKSAHPGEDGFGCGGIQTTAAEGFPPESEISDGRPAAEIFSRTDGTNQGKYSGVSDGSCVGRADCAAQRRVCGNGSVRPKLYRKGSGGNGDPPCLPECEGAASPSAGAISRLYDVADAGKLREELRSDPEGGKSHRVMLGTDPRGNVLRMDHALEQIAERLSQEQAELENLERQREAAKLEAEKPFPQEAELQEKSARLMELDAALNMEAGPAAEAICEEEPAEPAEKAEKPSIQARLSKTEEERETAPSSPKQHRNEEVR